MHILITYGSRRGGTEGIGRVLGEALQQAGHQVDVLPPGQAARATGFDAVIVGGALYANRWHRRARRFVSRRAQDLRRVPVWFFSSGPLDDSAQQRAIPPPAQVQILMERVGAQGHRTFGGRLLAGASGFPASAMAKEHSGDWRDPAAIRAWAAEISSALPTAKPGRVIVQPGRSWLRLLLHGLVGWALCALAMTVLLELTSQRVALALHLLAAPALFLLVARHYFHARGARDPLVTALGFAGVVALLDLIVVAGLVEQSLQLLGSVVGFWLPLLLILLVTWVTGEVLSMLPSRSTA
jgi:menaquinone-dependent protoporphyrinogen oxidase